MLVELGELVILRSWSSSSAMIFAMTGSKKLFIWRLALISIRRLELIEDLRVELDCGLIAIIEFAIASIRYYECGFVLLVALIRVPKVVLLRLELSHKLTARTNLLEW